MPTTPSSVDSDDTRMWQYAQALESVTFVSPHHDEHASRAVISEARAEWPAVSSRLADCVCVYLVDLFVMR